MRAARLDRLVFVVLVVGLAGFLSACGWQYAEEQVGERELTSPKKKVIVVEPKGPDPALVAKQAVENDPCIESASFVVIRLDEAKRTTRELSCDTGKVINESSEVIAEADLRTARAQNLPMESWFLLVDPNRPFRNLPDTINNKLLMALNQRFALRYHQRIPDKGLIIYRFEEIGFE